MTASASPLLLLHICAATVGLLSGFLSMLLPKGGGLHRAAGNVFFASMLTMSASAATIATFVHPIRVNLVVALLTLYLVSTAWRAARHPDGGIGPFDVQALALALSVAALSFAAAFEAAASTTGTKDGMPAGLYFFFGAMASLAVVSDVRMLRRGGATGPHRIARHLYRMCFALLIATFSLFPGQAKLFSGWLRESGVLLIPHVFLIGSLIYWRFRVLGRRARAKKRDLTVALASP